MICHANVIFKIEKIHKMPLTSILIPKIPSTRSTSENAIEQAYFSQNAIIVNLPLIPHRYRLTTIYFLRMTKLPSVQNIPKRKKGKGKYLTLDPIQVALLAAVRVSWSATAARRSPRLWHRCVAVPSGGVVTHGGSASYARYRRDSHKGR